MQMKALFWDCATIPEKIQRAGWRDAGLEGPHPKRNPCLLYTSRAHETGITPMMTESMITTASNFTFDDLFDAIVVYVGLIRFCLCK